MKLHKTLFASTVFALISASVGAAIAQEDFHATFADAAWNGETIPAGQHCKLQDGDGATPALSLSGLPAGTAEIHLAFNDESFEPMNNGGHGVLGFRVTPSDNAVEIPSVPGSTNELGDLAYIVKANGTSGAYLTEGYMPPCSGGRGNTYSVLISAVDTSGAVLGQKYLKLGTY